MQVQEKSNTIVDFVTGTIKDPYLIRSLDSRSYIGDRHYSTKAAGGNGGHSFEDIKDDTDVHILKLNYHEKDKIIKGIKVWFRNGEAVTRGKPRFNKKGYRDKEIRFDKNSEVETLELFKSNYKGGRLSGIMLKMKGGKTVKFGNLNDREVVDNVGGRILGFWGKDGADIDKLGFILSEHPVSWRIVPDESTWIVKDYDIKENTIENHNIDHCGFDSPSECVIFFQREFTTSRRYEGSFRIKAGAEVGFKAGVPILLVNGEWKVNFETEMTHTWGKTETDVKTITRTNTYHINPHSNQKIHVNVKQGTASAEGDVKVIATYADGTTLDFDNQTFATSNVDVYDTNMQSINLPCI